MKTTLGLVLGAISLGSASFGCVLPNGSPPRDGRRAEDAGPVDPGIALGLPAASDFSCANLDGSESACFDFNDGSATTLTTEGGRWENVGGRFVGFGPEVVPGACTGSLMTHALVPGLVVEDVSVHVQLASVARVDKVVVLRSTGEENRVQVNLRALDSDASYGDLVVQEIRDCEFIRYTQEGEVPIPHALGDAVEVDINLVGARLTVEIDGTTAFDRDVPVALRSGQVGLGIIERSTTMFDDIVVTSLD